MASNPFVHYTEQTPAFVRDLVPVTPNDATDVQSGTVGVGIYATGGGELVFETVDGIERTVIVPDYSTTLVSVTKIKTASTATGLFMLVV